MVQCPESLSVDQRIETLTDYMGWARAQHKDWSIQTTLAYRYGLLQRHRCLKTLRNVDADASKSHSSNIGLSAGLYERHDESASADDPSQLRFADQRVCLTSKDLSDYDHFVPVLVGGHQAANFCAVTQLTHTQSGGAIFEGRCAQSSLAAGSFSGQINILSPDAAEAHATATNSSGKFVNGVQFHRVGDCK